MIIINTVILILLPWHDFHERFFSLTHTCYFLTFYLEKHLGYLVCGVSDTHDFADSVANL